ncbi:hypothetical protein V6N13_090536 [Hibiscus sabdariffa]
MFSSGRFNGILSSQQPWFKLEAVLERKFLDFSSSMGLWKIRWEASFFKGSNTFECLSDEKPFFKLDFYSLMLAVNACLALGFNDSALGICCQVSHFDRFSIQVYGSLAKPPKLQKRCVCLSVDCRFIRCDVFSLLALF